MQVSPITNLVKTNAGWIAEIARGKAQVDTLFARRFLSVTLLHPRAIQLLPGQISYSIYLAQGECKVGFRNDRQREIVQGERLNMLAGEEGSFVHITASSQPAFYLTTAQRREPDQIANQPANCIPEKAEIIDLNSEYQFTEENRRVSLNGLRLGLEGLVHQINLSTLDNETPSGNHIHQAKWEVIVPVYGALRVALEDGKSLDIKEGQAGYLPPRIAHAIKNTSGHPAYFVEFSNHEFVPGTPNDTAKLPTPLVFS